MSNLIDIMAWKYKGCEYSCGEEYNSIIWRDTTVSKPTEEDIDTATIEYNAYRHANAYKRMRQEAYPSMEEQLDILYHEGLSGWRDIITSVKNKYPKGV